MTKEALKDCRIVRCFHSKKHCLVVSYFLYNACETCGSYLPTSFSLACALMLAWGLGVNLNSCSFPKSYYVVSGLRSNTFHHICFLLSPSCHLLKITDVYFKTTFLKCTLNVWEPDFWLAPSSGKVCLTLLQLLCYLKDRYSPAICSQSKGSATSHLTSI